MRFLLLLCLVGIFVPLWTLFTGRVPPTPLTLVWAGCGLVGFGGLAWLTAMALWNRWCARKERQDKP